MKLSQVQPNNISDHSPLRHFVRRMCPTWRLNFNEPEQKVAASNDRQIFQIQMTNGITQVKKKNDKSM